MKRTTQSPLVEPAEASTHRIDEDQIGEVEGRSERGSCRQARVSEIGDIAVEVDAAADQDIAGLVIATLHAAGGALHVDAMSRVIQGIMTGVGFIGAGVIIRNQEDDKIHGLTTADAVWIASHARQRQHAIV